MTICGIGNKDLYETKEEMRKDYDVKRDACIWEHNVSNKKLPCGHVGCNFHEGCYTCKMKKAMQAEDDDIEMDKVLVKELLKKKKQRATCSNRVFENSWTIQEQKRESLMTRASKSTQTLSTSAPVMQSTSHTNGLMRLA